MLTWAHGIRQSHSFLSIQAQDFIEELILLRRHVRYGQFLSIQAQDFIEERGLLRTLEANSKFLSIQAQDFIEEWIANLILDTILIPEHSSSGLH